MSISAFASSDARPPGCAEPGRLDACRRVANYLSVGQIDLPGNALLSRSKDLPKVRDWQWLY